MDDSNLANKEADVFDKNQPQTKDTLLSEHPPWIPKVGILVIAALLAGTIVITRRIDYQDTVPINLTLKVSNHSDAVYGEGYLQHEAVNVRTDQMVLIDWQKRQSTKLTARVENIAVVSKNSLYLIRVELPGEILADPELRSRLQEEVQMPARIVTHRVRLFDKLFGMFRLLSANN
jgi:hypothetical protein